MRREGYDEYADHNGDHERLLDQIRDLMEAQEADTFAEVRDEFAARLEAWFVDRFRAQDARLHGRLTGA